MNICPRKILRVVFGLWFAAGAWLPAAGSQQEPPANRFSPRNDSYPSALSRNLSPQKPSSPGQASRQAPKSQQNPTGDEPQVTIRRRTELVVVPVTVKDDAGKLVSDLGKDEFRVFEDNVEQKVDVFTSEAFPLSAVVLVDNELSTKVADQVETSLPAIAGGFSAQDEVAVARFDVRLHWAGEFTSDNDKLLTQLQRVNLDREFPAGPPGGPFSGPTINGKPAPGTESSKARGGITIMHKASKDIDDAVYEAGQMLQQRARERRKIIVLISDGNNSKNNTNKYKDVVRLLLTSGIAVYSVGVGNANLDRGLSVLSKYAHATGGDVFYGLKRDTIENLYASVTEESRNQYTLAYVPRGTDRALEYHTIEVRARRPNLTLVTREGYYSAGR